MNKTYYIRALFLIAITVKLSLFFFAHSNAPQSIIQPDSQLYLQTGETLAKDGVFGEKVKVDAFRYEWYRTPGYPLFLGVLTHQMNVSLVYIVLIQILMSVFTAWILMQSALMIDPKLGTLSAVIILFDPTIAVHSMFILAETLFMFLLSIFLWSCVKFLKSKNKKCLWMSAIVLAAACYVKPIALYLGVIFAIFLVLSEKNKKMVSAALVFLFIVYGLTGLWNLRNYAHSKQFKFSSISQTTLQKYGVLDKKERESIETKSFKSSILSLLTRPTSLKYFNSKILKKGGKLFAYPWILFWMIGLLAGLLLAKRNVYYWMCLLCLSYFIVITMAGAWNITGPRFRVPMMPFIALFSAMGWRKLLRGQVNSR